MSIDLMFTFPEKSEARPVPASPRLRLSYFLLLTSYLLLTISLPFKRRFNFWKKPGRKLPQLLFLTASVMTFSVLSLTLGTSLFLNHGGPQYLPLSYILMGGLSIPLYTWFSQIIDRYPRPHLFRWFLLAASVFILGLQVLLPLNILPVYYGLHIGLYIQWILALEILLPSIVSDYFTALDWKRYTPQLRMAKAAGGLLGGGITSLLATQITTQQSLLSLPLFYGIVFLQLLYLEYTVSPLPGDLSEDTGGGIGATLKILPGLVTQYPIIFYLGASALFSIVLYSVAEFQYFSIYAQTFANEEQLTAFLGVLRMVNNLVPFFVLYFITRPLLKRLGVSGMNIVYPLTALGSFLSLALNPTLATAVGAHLNADGLDDSLNQPIHTLNYNGVPYEFVGRIRVLCEGIFFAFGLIIAGSLLWLSQAFLSFGDITTLGLLLASFFLIVRYLMGKSYLQSLLQMLRSGSVKLQDVSEGLPVLPSQYSPQVRELLLVDDYHDNILGLELALRLENPSQFLPLMETLNSQDAGIRRAMIKFLSQIHHPQIRRYLHSHLTLQDETLTLIALEAAIASGQPLTEQELYFLITSEQSEIQVLACIAAQNQKAVTLEIQGICTQIWDSTLDEPAREAVIRGVGRTLNRELMPWLEKVIADASPGIKLQGLDTLAKMAAPGDEQSAQLAAAELTHFDPLVRAAALKLLGVIQSPTLLNQVAAGLTHSNLAVRLWAASALATYGERCLGVSQPYLHSPRPEVVEGAIAAIGKVKSRRAVEILFNYLKVDYDLVPLSLQWLQKIPPQDSQWQPLRVALEDYHGRLIHRVLYILSNLDGEGNFSEIRRILATQDVRRRANAIETLASCGYRRFVLPILPLFEEVEPGGAAFKPLSPLKQERLLNTILESSSRRETRWLRIGALKVAFAKVTGQYSLPARIMADEDPLVQQFIKMKVESSARQDYFIEKIFFLKSIVRLKNLFLDELLLIYHRLNQKQISAGETICSPQDVLGELHILYQGTALLYQNQQTVIQLTPGDFLGEMNLFDDTLTTQLIVAQTDCTLFTLSKESFGQLIDRCPRLLISFSLGNMP